MIGNFVTTTDQHHFVCCHGNLLLCLVIITVLLRGLLCRVLLVWNVPYSFPFCLRLCSSTGHLKYSLHTMLWTIQHDTWPLLRTQSYLCSALPTQRVIYQYLIFPKGGKNPLPSISLSRSKNCTNSWGNSQWEDPGNLYLLSLLWRNSHLNQ